MGQPDAPMQLDVCRTCHLVWLDHGEEEQLPRSEPEPVQAALEPALPDEARKALALWKVGELREAHLRSAPPSTRGGRLAGYLGLPVLENAAPTTDPALFTWAVAVFMMLASLWAWKEPLLDSEFGFLPGDPWRHGCATPFTSFFIHGSLGHLLGNGYFLLVFGAAVEALLGPLRYLSLLAAGVILGVAGHVLVDPRSDILLIGASDGISAIIAYYALAFPHARVRIFIFHRWLAYGQQPAWRWLSISVRTALVLWIGLQLRDTLHQAQALTHVSSAAHLGGAAAGFIAWLLWRR